MVLDGDEVVPEGDEVAHLVQEDHGEYLHSSYTYIHTYYGVLFFYAKLLIQSFSLRGRGMPRGTLRGAMRGGAPRGGPTRGSAPRGAPAGRGGPPSAPARGGSAARSRPPSTGARMLPSAAMSHQAGPSGAQPKPDGYDEYVS